MAADEEPPTSAPAAGASLERLVVGDEPAAWAAAGFTLIDPPGDSDPVTVRIGPLTIELIAGERRGLRSWALWSRQPDTAAIDAEGRLDGLRTTLVDAATPDEPTDPTDDTATHPNGVVGLDHLVLVSPDVARTTTVLASIGLDARRTRHTDQYGAPMVQRFFRAGATIVELIGPIDATPDAGPTRFFGLAFTVDDLDATAGQLGTCLGSIKDAVQPGRRIATLRHRDLDVSVPIAFMSAEPHRSS